MHRTVSRGRQVMVRSGFSETGKDLYGRYGKDRYGKVRMGKLRKGTAGEVRTAL